MPCPVCRKEFVIPQNGLSELQHNFFIQSLHDVKEARSDSAADAPCEACQTKNTGEKATMYCATCNQKLCERCSWPHQTWKNGAHKVDMLGKELRVEIIQMRSSYCEKHADKQLEWFCFDCKVTICVGCFIIEHRQHNCREISKVAKEFVAQIGKHISGVESRIEQFERDGKQLEEEKKNFMDDNDKVRAAVDEKCRKTKRLIDSQASELQTELQAVRASTLKEVETCKEGHELALVAMKSFTAYCTELKDKGRPCDVTGAANDLQARADELLKTYVSAGDYNAPRTIFLSMDISELSEGAQGQNFIGRIDVRKKAGRYQLLN